MKQNGFNLIELMIVMAVIGIIAGVGWPMFLEQGRSSNRTDAIIATSAVALALTQFDSDNTGGFVWDPAPVAGDTVAVNAHARYLPMVAVGPASDGGSTNDAICTRDRGFRFSFANNQYESCRGYYSITVAIGVDATLNPTFLITTTAIPGLPQSNDFECNQFTLTNNGVKGHVAIDGPGIFDQKPVTDQGGPANVDGPLHSTNGCWGSD